MGCLIILRRAVWSCARAGPSARWGFSSRKSRRVTGAGVGVSTRIAKRLNHRARTANQTAVLNVRGRTGSVLGEIRSGSGREYQRDELSVAVFEEW